MEIEKIDLFRFHHICKQKRAVFGQLFFVFNFYCLIDNFFFVVLNTVLRQ